MAGLIRRSDIDEVRSRINISDVVSDYIAIRSAGPGSYKGLCPFHDEKSPSFHIKNQNARYHCFGCGESGDVFSFVQKMDQISFTEAVERLAQKINYPLQYEDGGTNERERGQRSRILAANRAAAEYFQEQLKSEEAAIARDFLLGRNFTAGQCAQFGVGYAPKSYDAMSKALAKLGYSAEELLAAGLTGQGERSNYDRFRGRVVWPIKDTTGQVLGFGARKLFDDDNGPKYLNTPETVVYKKSQVLYGLDQARKPIAQKKQVVIVEGYTDVMACHLAGIQTAVASCGTAFGVDHINSIRRVMGDDTPRLGEIIFTFDPDAAGQKAALKAFSEEKRFTAQTYVASEASGLDPCDLRIQYGDEAVRQLITQKVPMFEFAIRQIILNHNLDTVEGRAAALRESAPIIAQLRDPSLKPGYVRVLAGLIGVEITEVRAAVKQAANQPITNRNTPNYSATQQASTQNNTGLNQTGSLASREAQSAQAASAALQSNELAEAEAAKIPAIELLSVKQIRLTPQSRLELETLIAMIQFPKLIKLDQLPVLAAVRFENQAFSAVRDAVILCFSDYESPSWIDQIAETVDPRLSRLVAELSVLEVPTTVDGRIQAYVTGITNSIIERELSRTKTELMGKLSRLSNTDAGSAEYKQVQQALAALELQRRRLRDE